MRYRGILLHPTDGDPFVMTDGQQWMREFFLQGDKLIPTYSDYLRCTFSPLAHSGVHVIASAPSQAVSAAYFSEMSEKLVRQLYQLTRAAAAAPSPVPAD